MIHSMTGFGRAGGHIMDREINVEIRAVNNRFRDVIVRMPKTYGALEDSIKKSVGGQVARGRIEVALQIDESASRAKHLKLDLELANSYKELLIKLKSELQIVGDVGLDHLIGLRDVIRHEEEDLDLDAFWLELEKVIREALSNLIAMRQVEGAAIARDFTNRLEIMRKHVDEIAARRDIVVNEAKAKLENRIQVYTEGLEIDRGRLAQEVAYICDRSDITEEVVRLKSHFEQFESLLASEEALGRKLEFLLQEINREVNTVGSKSSDIDITNHVVDLKTELEKLREQVLNVE